MNKLDRKYLLLKLLPKQTDMDFLGVIKNEGSFVENLTKYKTSKEGLCRIFFPLPVPSKKAIVFYIMTRIYLDL